MNKIIAEFRQKLRLDVLHFLYEKYFFDRKFYSTKDIYEGLDEFVKFSYVNKCPIGLLYTFEFNAALAYLKDIDYVILGTTEDDVVYGISVSGIKYLECLYSEQTDKL